MAFETTFPLRFGDVDFAGIAYYPSIFNYFHLAFEEFWKGYMGVYYSSLIREEDITFPVVHVQTDFIRPVKFGDEMTFRIWVSRIRISSVNFDYRILVDGEIRAAATLTHVAVNAASHQVVPIPAKYREKLRACGEVEDTPLA